MKRNECAIIDRAAFAAGVRLIVASHHSRRAAGKKIHVDEKVIRMCLAEQKTSAAETTIAAFHEALWLRRDAAKAGQLKGVSAEQAQRDLVAFQDSYRRPADTNKRTRTWGFSAPELRVGPKAIHSVAFHAANASRLPAGELFPILDSEVRSWRALGQPFWVSRARMRLQSKGSASELVEDAVKGRWWVWRDPAGTRLPPTLSPG